MVKPGAVSAASGSQWHGVCDDASIMPELQVTGRGALSQRLFFCVNTFLTLWGVRLDIRRKECTMEQAVYLFTIAKGIARMHAKEDGCPWYVVRERQGFVAEPVRDFAQECWRISPDGTVQRILPRLTLD